MQSATELTMGASSAWKVTYLKDKVEWLKNITLQSILFLE